MAPGAAVLLSDTADCRHSKHVELHMPDAHMVCCRSPLLDKAAASQAAPAPAATSAFPGPAPTPARTPRSAVQGSTQLRAAHNRLSMCKRRGTYVSVHATREPALLTILRSRKHSVTHPAVKYGVLLVLLRGPSASSTSPKLWLRLWVAHVMLHVVP